MNNKIITFFLGVFVTISVAATTDMVTLVKPMKPIKTEVKTFRAMAFIEKDVKEYIDSKVKEGYIVKSVEMIDDDSWSKAVIVVERY